MSRLHQQPQAQPSDLVVDPRALEFRPGCLDRAHGARDLGDLMGRVIDGLSTTFERQLVASAAGGGDIESPCVCGAPLEAHFDRRQSLARGRWLGCEHAASVANLSRDAARCEMHQESR